MGLCTACGFEMLDPKTKTCTVTKLQGKSGDLHDRIAHFDLDGNKARCDECKVEEGGYHHVGCDQEDCPICSGQFITCDCDVWETGDD